MFKGKEEIYRVEFSVFNFFNEKVWPMIFKSFLSEIENGGKSFVLKANISLQLLQKLYPNIDVDNAIYNMIDDMHKFLYFQYIGGVKDYVILDDKLSVEMKVMF